MKALLFPSCHCHNLGLWLLVLLGDLLLVKAQSKEVIFFAGPHSTGTTSVQKFFHNHVSGVNKGRISEGLRGWRWPNIKNNPMEFGSKHKVFNLLVTQAYDMDLTQRMLKDIQTAWYDARQGIIIGSEEFDHVGANPYSGYDAIDPMNRIIEKLGVATSHVTVVLNYRVPRLYQWASLFKHTDAKHYKDFMCRGGEQLWELLDTAMNPLRLATAFRNQGWNVVLIDMGGADAMGRDIVHVIACDVLKESDCKDGWVTDHYNRTYHESESEYDFTEGGSIVSLPTEDEQISEQLFRERDCHYKRDLETDDRVRIIYNDTLWKGCLKGEENENIYKQLTDTDFFLNVLRKQKGCAKDSKKININSLLVGDYETMTNSTIAGPVAATEEEKEFFAKDPLIREIDKKGESPLITALFLFAIIGASINQLKMMYEQQQQNKEKKELSQVELEEMGQALTEPTDEDHDDDDNNDDHPKEMVLA